MLKIEDITYSVEGRPLFEGASATIPTGHKVGLVGRNGAGKTTLFRLIRGELALEGGAISIPSRARIGGVAQEVPSSSTSLLETVLQADTGIDLHLRQPGGFQLCLSDEEMAEESRRLLWLREAMHGDYPFELLDAEQLRARLPGVDDGMAYSIYLCAGLLAWGLFSEITLRSQNMFLDNANLLKKISFPRICLPVIVLLNAGINFAIILALFIGFLLISGRLPGMALLALVPLLALQVMFSAGLGMILGVLNVFFRDVGQFFGILLQFWFWLTPIVYPMSILPEGIQRVLALNPLTALMHSYQNVFLYNQWPDWSSLTPLLVIGLLFCLMGLRLFRQRVGEMVDEL